MKYLFIFLLLTACTAKDWCDPNSTRSDIDYCNCNKEKCQPSNYKPKDKPLHVAYADLPECDINVIAATKFYEHIKGDDGAYLYVSNRDGWMCLDRSEVKK